MQPAPSAPVASVAKGTGLLGIVRSIRDRYGEGGVRATFELLPGDVGEAFRFGHVVPVGWYPVAWYSALLGAARQGLRENELLPFRLSHDAVKRDFSGIFQVAIRALSPEMVFRHGPRLMPLYWKGGRVDVLDARPGYGRLRFAGWRGFDRNIWLDIQGGIVAMLEIRGAKNVKPAVVAGGHDGSDDLDLEVRWG